jgi:hypothetical protein
MSTQGRNRRGKEHAIEQMGLALTKRNALAQVGGLFQLIFLVVFEAPYALLDSLLYVGRGIKCHSLVSLLVISVLLLLIASNVETLAGDMVFLLWTVFVGKWLVEVVWATARRRRNPDEWRYHGGVSLMTAVGLHGDRQPYLVTLILGFALAALPAGEIVGVIVVLGSIGGLIIETLLDHRINEYFAKQQDDRHMMELQARQQDGVTAGPVVFQDVRIE